LLDSLLQEVVAILILKKLKKIDNFAKNVAKA